MAGASPDDQLVGHTPGRWTSPDRRLVTPPTVGPRPLMQCSPLWISPAKRVQPAMCGPITTPTKDYSPPLLVAGSPVSPPGDSQATTLKIDEGESDSNASLYSKNDPVIEDTSANTSTFSVSSDDSLPSFQNRNNITPQEVADAVTSSQRPCCSTQLTPPQSPDDGPMTVYQASGWHYMSTSELFRKHVFLRCSTRLRLLTRMDNHWTPNCQYNTKMKIWTLQIFLTSHS